MWNVSIKSFSQFYAYLYTGCLKKLSGCLSDLNKQILYRKCDKKCSAEALECTVLFWWIKHLVGLESHSPHWFWTMYIFTTVPNLCTCVSCMKLRKKVNLLIMNDSLRKTKDLQKGWIIITILEQLLYLKCFNASKNVITEISVYFYLIRFRTSLFHYLNRLYIFVHICIC